MSINTRNEIIENIYTHVENGDVDKAVFACLRLSRSIGDIFNTLLFLKELHPDKKQYTQAFYDEVKDIKEEAQKILWKTVTEHWIEGRSLEYSLTDEPDRTVIILGVGEMQKEIVVLSEIISDLKAPIGMTAYDLAAFTDRYDSDKSQFRLKIKGINSILERIRTRCLNYASKIEHQLTAQKEADSFLMQVQNEVNTYFSSRSEDTYTKLIKATDLLYSKNSEDHALLLTSIRRAIHSVANYFYPPVNEEVMGLDGKFHKMGDDQYINRLGEFVNKSFIKSTSTDVLKAELHYLMVFATKINEIASKGVHNEVTKSEAKQGLLGLYLFLANVIEKLEYSAPESSIAMTLKSNS